MRERGTIKMVNKDRGFGFIRPDGAPSHGKDVFFHCSQLPNKNDIETLEDGQTVTFEQESAEDGRQRASNIQYE